MDTNITISLVMPIYGVEKYIGRFAESVLGQTYPHIQFVFVNDGTRDRSIDILEGIIDEKYGHLRDRIVIVHKENGGLPSARKTGMEYVRGDYVWHIDSDDWIGQDAVAKIAMCAEATGADVIYFDFYKEYEGRTRLKVESDYADKDRYIRDMYNHQAFGCVWNKCVCRRLYQENEVHFPKYSYAEDTFLMSQLVGYASGMTHLKEPLYHYRKDNPHAITKQKRTKRRREAVMNFLSLYEIYSDKPLQDNPVLPITDDIFYRAGWYSLIYGFGFFREYPYLADKILKAEIRGRSDIGIPIQIVLKVYVFLRRMLTIKH